MKKNVLVFLSVLFLFASCDNPADVKDVDVTFTMNRFSYNDINNGETYTLVDIRILGDFNDWAGATTSEVTTWNNALPMSFNNTSKLFEATKTFEEGTEILYTYIAKFSNLGSETPEVITAWPNPAYIRSEQLGYLFSPMDSLVDNGMGNGGKNIKYTVK